MSRTVLKPEPGFRAELPGLDLATLIQMTCARRERLVVRVSSYGEEGFLYSAEGRLVHAAVGKLVGDEAVLRMLAWPTGDFSICERAFPLQPTVLTSTEGLLLRAAARADEAARGDLHDELGLSEQLEGPEPPPPPAPLPAPILPPRVSRPPPPPRRLPPLPPPKSRPAEATAIVASVRLDARGEVVGAFGPDDQLSQLVAYISRIAALVQADFALEPFDAMHAELSGKRVLIYQEAGELVGVVMKPGADAQALRQRLGV